LLFYETNHILPETHKREKGNIEKRTPKRSALLFAFNLLHSSINFERAQTNDVVRKISTVLIRLQNPEVTERLVSSHWSRDFQGIRLTLSLQGRIILMNRYVFPVRQVIRSLKSP